MENCYLNILNYYTNFPCYLMLKMKKFYLFGLLLFFAFNGMAQDTIVHRNGNEFVVEILKENESRIIYKLWNLPDSRTFTVDKSTIFSIKRKNHKVDILYSYNPEMGNTYQVDEMRLYIKGQQDARKFNSPISNVASIVGGAAGGYVLGQGGILGITAPIVMPILVTILPPRMKKKTVRDSRFSPIEAYREGYFREAKKKRYFKSLVLSSISLGISTAITALAID